MTESRFSLSLFGLLGKKDSSSSSWLIDPGFFADLSLAFLPSLLSASEMSFSESSNCSF